MKRDSAVYITCLNPAFSTTDNGCIAHVMKLPIASTKVCHCSLSFCSGLTCSKTFCSVGCDYSTSLSFSPSALNNTVYLLRWYHSNCTQRFVVFLQYKTSDKQSRQTALSLTGAPFSLLKTQNGFHTWLLPAVSRTILFSDTIFTTQ